MIDERTFDRITQRAAALEAWLEREAPYAQFDQRHLDPHTPEQAYWHLGYQRALSDVLSADQRNWRQCGHCQSVPAGRPG